jgi:hypothetical protein
MSAWRGGWPRRWRSGCDFIRNSWGGECSGALWKLAVVLLKAAGRGAGKLFQLAAHVVLDPVGQAVDDPAHVVSEFLQ